MSGRAGLRAQLGGVWAGSAALGVLVLGCVFAATAGPRYSLDSRTHALQSAVADLPSDQTAVQVSADWTMFSGAVTAGTGNLSDAQFTDSDREIGQGLSAIRLPVTSGGWYSMTTPEDWDYSGILPAHSDKEPVRLELAYSPRLLANATLVAGAFVRPGTVNADGPLPVAISAGMASEFGLHPGSRLTLISDPPGLQAIVTAVVRPVAAGTRSFWLSLPEGAQPILQNRLARKQKWTPATLGPSYKGPYWVAGMFAETGSLAALQDAYRLVGMSMTWEYPLKLSGLTADQVAALTGSLAGAAANPLRLTGDLRDASSSLSVSSSLPVALGEYTTAEESVQQVLSLAAASLAVTGMALLLLAARLVAATRAAEFTMLRSRGGSLRQVTLHALRGSVLTCLPGAALGAAAAVLVTPGLSPPLASWLGGATALTAVLGLPLIVAWQYRGPSRAARRDLPRAGRVLRRLIAEVTACAAAVGALIVLHAQGAPAGSVNWYVAVAPALIAVPAVIVTARLYPLVIRAVLPVQARGGGATGFLAMAQAARTSLAGAGPVFGLVLALTLAAFSGMVQGAVSGGQVSASWQTTGADVLVTGGPAAITGAQQQAVAALPGVRRVTGVWQVLSLLPDDQPVATALVDPASYAAFTASTPFPVVRAGELSSRGGVLSVLASPAVAAELGGGVVALASDFGPFQVRVAGTVASTASFPGASPDGAAFVIVPDVPLFHPGFPPQINQLLITGSGVSRAALAKILGPEVTITFRSTVLAGLTGSPLQAGAFLLLRLSLVVAAGFGLIIVMIGLALGSADRDLTLARLSTMGMTGGRLGRLVLYETLPAIIASVVAGAACTLTLPRLIAPALNLDAFTGPGAAVTLAPSLADVALPALALLLLTILAVAAEVRDLRRRGVAALLRF